MAHEPLHIQTTKVSFTRLHQDVIGDIARCQLGSEDGDENRDAHGSHVVCIADRRDR